jgi:trk system potassium uptake protein TrkA
MKIVIVGAGAVGTHLSRLLSREHQDCVLIDDNEERLSGLGEYDVMTYCDCSYLIIVVKECLVVF